MSLLAVSMGDPAGIGPEVILKAASVADVRAVAQLVVFGDAGILRKASEDTGVPMNIVPVQRIEDARKVTAQDSLAVFSVSSVNDPTFSWGRPVPGSDAAQVEYIKAALRAVSERSADALVTAPISKAALSRAGAPWPGHTDMLAELCGVPRPVMMLAGPTLKVVPVTTHVPLAQVPRQLTRELICHAIRVTDSAFREYFGRHKPRIGVAGLNPHAGEGGLFGREELEVIGPAVEASQQEGIEVSGPHSADTVFHRAVNGSFDVVIGMYHDQALIPLKLLDFDTAVNVTLGLPIIRTSVDHGTAYDIAGRGVASAASMIAALRLAARMKHGRRDSDPRGASHKP